MKNKRFSLPRFGKLVASELRTRKSAIIISAITIIGLLLLYNLIFSHNIISVNRDPTGFMFLLFVGGIWISSSGFSSFHEKQGSYFFLTLPCSNFEKFLSRWAFTSIIYALSILILYTLFYWVFSLMSYPFYQHNHFVSTPFLMETWHLIWLYMLAQSLFLLGSVYFKKLALIKTILVISSIGIVLVLLILLISKILVADLLVTNPLWLQNYISAGTSMLKLMRSFLEIFLAPFCWFVTYIRLIEIEV